MIPDATNTSEVFSGGVGDIQAGTFFGDLSGTATNITASSNTSLTSLSNLTTVGTLGSLVVSGATSGDLVRITQTGAGNAFVVEDSTNPDSTPFVITGTGSVLLGATSARSVGGSYQTSVLNQIFNEQGSGGLTAFTSVLNRADNNALRFVLGKSRGTDAGAVTALVNNDNIAEFYFAGADGTTLDPLAAMIRVGVDGAVATGSVPGRLTFLTTPVAGTTPLERMRITAAGNVGIGTSSPTANLNVYSVSNTNVLFDSGASINLTFNRAGTGNYNSIRLNTAGTTRWAYGLQNDATDNFFIGSGVAAYDSATAPKFVIQPGGNVGIGTSSPTEKLDVVGNIALTGSVIFEGATANNFETTVSVTDPTADRTITFPDATGTVAISGQNVSFNDVTVAGNLNVTGSTFGSATLDVDNFKITLNASVTGAPTLNGEIEVNRGTSTDVRIRWNEASDLWEYTNDGSSYSRIGSALMTVSDTPPSSPYTGDLWFESDSGITFVRYDSHWIEIGASGIGAVTSDTAPSSPANGQIWFESDTNQLKIYYSGTWIQVGGSDAVNVINAIDAKGDLIVGTANDTVTRLGAGTNGSVLSANSSTASGLEWVSRAAIVDDFAVASIMGAY
jgi:hypothetical protein